MKKYLLFISIFILYSCEKNNNIESNPLSFELQNGQSNVYKVTDESYSLTSKPIISTYYIEEKVSNKTLRSIGETNYIIIQSRKTNLSDNWSAIKMYNIVQSANQVVSYELGTPQVNLVFPIVSNLKWNKNQLNSLAAANYQYKDINVNKINFTNTYTAFLNNDSTLIDLSRHYEIYNSTGLLSKEITDLQYCQSNPSCIGSGKIDSGTRIIWTKIN